MGDELFDLLAPTVDSSGLELVDVEVRAGTVRVVVDRPGGAPLDDIAEVTRAVSAALDEHDPLPGQRYTLEVSSPGVERPLRLPRHFARAVGETVTVRTVAGGQGERRVTGRLVAADDAGIEVAPEGEETTRRFAYDDIERARTVFAWGPAARPARGGGKPAKGRRPGDRKKVTTP